MAIAEVQNLGGINTGGATSVAGTFGSTTVSGNQVTVGSRVGATGRTVTVSDSKTNTYSQAKNQVQTTDGHELFVHYSPNIVGGAAHQVTVSISGASAAIRVSIYEHSGLATSTPVDQAVGAQSFSTALDSGPATTTQAAELLFSVGSIGGSQTFTVGASYGHLTVSPSGASNKYAGEDQIVAATGTYHGTFSVPTNDNWACILVTFKGAGGGSIKTIAPTANLTFAEAATLVKTAKIAAADNLTFAETAAIVKTAKVAAADTITFAETSTLVKAARVQTAVNLTFAEAVVLVGGKTISPTDHITFSEAVTLIKTAILAPQSTITFAEVANLIRTAAATPTRVVSGFAPAFLRMLGRWN